MRLTSATRNQSPTGAPPEGRVGQPLSTLLGTPWELGEFLRVAAGIAKAVGGLHQRGVIHKHLQPSNIQVDTVTGEAWLTGPDPSTTTAEAVPPMAPEQGGRMNRSVDATLPGTAAGLHLRRVVAILFCSIAGPCALIGQEGGTVRGTVTRAGTEGGVRDAIISLVGTSVVAVTDAKGRFVLQPVPLAKLRSWFVPSATNHSSVPSS